MVSFMIAIALSALAWPSSSSAQEMTVGVVDRLLVLSDVVVEIRVPTMVEVQDLDSTFCDGGTGVAALQVFRPTMRVNLVSLHCDGEPEAVQINGVLVGSDHRYGIAGNCVDASCSRVGIPAQSIMTLRLSTLPRQLLPQ